MMRRDMLALGVPAAAGAVLLRGTGGTPPAPLGYREPSQPGIAAGPAAGLVRARTIIVSGAGGGEFIYDASGNLRSANVGADTTDPIQHITCHQGFSTFNGFGAVISLLSTAVAAYFQYLDTLSAAQGALSYSSAARPVTDPISGQSAPQGVQIWNGTLDFLTPVARVGQIGVNGLLASPFLGYMEFLTSLGYHFDTTVVAEGGITSRNPVAPFGQEQWHSLGTLAGYTITRAQYRLAPEYNKVVFDISVAGSGANAATVTFSNTLIAPYLPPVSYTLTLGSNATNAVGATYAAFPRLGITAGGAVSLSFIANVTGTVFGVVEMPTN